MTSTGVEVRTIAPGRVELGLTANTPATATVAVMTAVAKTIEIWRILLSKIDRSMAPIARVLLPVTNAPTAARRHWHLANQAGKLSAPMLLRGWRSGSPHRRCGLTPCHASLSPRNDDVRQEAPVAQAHCRPRRKASAPL